MKKIVSIILIFLVLFSFSINLYAVELTGLNITTDKQNVHPNEEIRINIQFGEQLGSYTFDIAYDSNLLEYVTADGGTANDNGTRVRVYFYDTTGGSAPRENMSVTFRAKEEIVSSNPTDLSVTAEGLANSDATIEYDDITTPITKSIVVEPLYEDYQLNLSYDGEILENQEKEMKIEIRSLMGRNYEHTRIIAETQVPEGQTVKILGTDSNNLEHDIIQNGWGSSEGDPIGGENVTKELDVRGKFSGKGEYTITLKLINRDNSDEVIASETFEINVIGEKEEITNNTNQTTNNTTEDTNIVTNEVINENIVTNKPTNTPTSLPKTGNTIYFSAIILFACLVTAYYITKK